MFTLIKQAAKIVHINIRTENHGDEEIVAVDVRVSCDVPNTFLDELSPGLRMALYEHGAQAEIEEGHLTAVRFGMMGPVDWELSMLLAQFVIHVGRKADDLEFTADINKLRLAPKDGGTVALSFRAQVLPDPAQVGALSEHLGHKVKVSVTPGPVLETPPERE